MRAIFKLSRRRPLLGFSLVEVIVALGIFAGGILVVLALVPLANQSAASGREAEAAVQSAGMLLAQLRSQPFSAVIPWLQTPDEIIASDATSESNPTAFSRCYYASLNGQRMGGFDDAVWVGHEAERHFEIALIRNLELSPVAMDSSRGWIAFSLRVRWPVYQRRAGGDSAASDGNPQAVDAGNRQWCLVSGSVRR